MSTQPDQGKPQKRADYLGGYVGPDAVKKVLEISSKTGRPKSEIIRDALRSYGGSPAPVGIYKLAARTLQAESLGVVATLQTATLGTKGSTYAPDRRVIEAQSKLTKPTIQNLVWAYENEVTLQALFHLISQTIIGAGYTLSSPDQNQAAIKVIEDFYKAVNITEWIENTIVNVGVLGNALYRLRKEDKINEYVEVCLLDWSTITVYKHPTEGWIKYIQVVKVPKDVPPTQEGFYSDTFDPTRLQGTTAIEDKRFFFRPEDVVHARVRTRGLEVGTSMIESTVTSVVYKKLIEYYLSQTAEIYGSPRIVAFVGDANNPPQTKEEQDAIAECMDNTLTALISFRNFGAMVLGPGVREIQIYSPSQGVMDYEKVLNYLKREIFLSALCSTALFEAKGVELATSRTISTVWHESLSYYMRMLKDTLERQIHPRVLELAGMKDAKVEITINTPEKWSAQEAVQLYNAGILTLEEIRAEWNYPEEKPESSEVPPSQPPLPAGPEFPQYGNPATTGGSPWTSSPPSTAGGEFKLLPQSLGIELRPDKKYEIRTREIEEKAAKQIQDVYRKGMADLGKLRRPSKKEEPKK